MDNTEKRSYFRTEVIEDHVLVITIDRPEARNAFNLAMALQLEAIVDRFDEDDALWVAVLRGEGTTFCAGHDLKAAAISEIARAPKRGGFGMMTRPPLKPVIAAIEGHAYAGGLELALSCDMIVASEESRFALTEVKRGLVATGGGCFRLRQRIPYHLAMEMILTGEPRSAAEMHAHGLLAKVTAPGKTFEAALELARKVMVNAPIAVRASKEIVSRSQAEGWTEEEGWSKQRGPAGRNAESEDKREGLAAFAEKRSPVWKNR